MDVVIVATGPNLGQVFQLAGDKPIVIGRHSPAIKLLDSRVSRSHARLVPCDGTWQLEDLQSSNGTFLNGQQLKSAAQLSPGDRLQVGQTLMIFTRLAATADSEQIALNDPALTPAAGGDAADSADLPASQPEQLELEDDALDDSDLGDLIGSSDKAQPPEDFADLLLDDAAPSEAGGLSHEGDDGADEPDLDEPAGLDDSAPGQSDNLDLDLPVAVEIEPADEAADLPAPGDAQPVDLIEDELSGSGLDLADGIEIELMDPEPDAAGPIASGRPESPVDDRADVDQDESDEPEILSDLLSHNPSAGSIMDDQGDSDQTGLPLNLEDDDDDPRG